MLELGIDGTSTTVKSYFYCWIPTPSFVAHRPKRAWRATGHSRHRPPVARDRLRLAASRVLQWSQATFLKRCERGGSVAIKYEVLNGAINTYIPTQTGLFPKQLGQLHFLYCVSRGLFSLLVLSCSRALLVHGGTVCHLFHL